MEIDTRFAGTTLRSRKTTVNWRDTMNYAAAVGDNNPLYFDDTRDTGIIAPLMFCVALTWPISERLGEYIESEDFPEEVIPTQVHYTEHIHFHRCIKPGDRLTIAGRIAAICPHRSCLVPFFPGLVLQKQLRVVEKRLPPVGISFFRITVLVVLFLALMTKCLPFSYLRIK
ncbi:MAG: FAS1-like dehydratase domain-containing protein [Desulfosalsimonas sp.]